MKLSTLKHAALTFLNGLGLGVVLFVPDPVAIVCGLALMYLTW